MNYQYSSYSGFRCVACNIGFDNFDDQKQHYFAYHSRNMNMTRNVAPTAFKPIKRVTKINKPLVQAMKCDVCNISCSSAVVFDFHIKGKKHSKTLKKIILMEKGNQNNISSTDVDLDVKNDISQVTQNFFTADLVCKDCSVNCGTMDQLQLHLTGGKHIKTLKMKRFANMKEKKDPSVYCDICDLFLLDDLMTMHRDGFKHKRKCNETSSTEPVGKKSKVLITVDHCGHCRLDLADEEEAVQHYQSALHGKNVPKYPFSCPDCVLSFNTDDILKAHLKGFKHYAKINQGNANPEGEMAEKLLIKREKMRTLRTRINASKFSYQEKYTFVSEPTIVDNSVLTDHSLEVGVTQDSVSVCHDATKE